MDGLNTKEEKKQLLENLVKKFEENSKQYKSNLYDEANTRADFIDQFFMLLDWDMYNSANYAEQYREVVREDKVRINGGQKAPDYSFRLAGVKKFFVEAKKPAVSVKTASEAAFQVRRYGYSAKLPISILTNFEEFAVYDTRIKPSKTDDASVARIFYCTYQDYLKEFDFLYNTFSKSAILKGRLDRYVEENKHKRGTSEVDSELLKTLENWREELAKNIALNNPDIKLYELNLAVQKIVDRIIFLRIAEDKGIEEYSTLLNACKLKSTEEKSKSSIVYSTLVNLFNKANIKYNSGLFATLTFLDALKIDDKIFKNIIEDLYYPDCPYEFSILPVEILGSIYEQFLGKTIKFRGVRGDKHTAIIEEKPEVKKAGGVYYTPEYIVNYIVEKTVGAITKNKSPSQIENIKIIDPSCGSGSFLVGAYSYLLKHALDYYSNAKHTKKALKEGRIYQVAEKAYKLTIEEKQRILLASIYGVDIDEQAVEVSKLSLYLKLLEDEGGQALSRSELFKHTDFTILPSLTGNIKCGNALVESDYYLNKEVSLFEDIDAMRAINVFDWQKEFENVFATGGFDCVIGNPPYVSAGNQVATEKLKKQREYLKQCGKYSSLYKQWDLYIPFIEKGLNILKDGGAYGVIVPYPLANQSYGYLLRKKILKHYNLVEIADLNGNKIFAHATVTNCIPIIRKEKPSDMIAISHIDAENNINVAFEKPIKELVIDEKTGVWNLEEKKKEINKHKELHILGDFCYIAEGLHGNSNEKIAKGEFKKADLISDFMDEKHPRKYIEGKDISRYSINRIRYFEYGTKRSPAKLRCPTFEEFYYPAKIFINTLGKMIATLDISNRILHNHKLLGVILWKDLKTIENRSIAICVKRYSRLLRIEMEELSKKVNLYYLLAILNSKYASYLLSVQRVGDFNIYSGHIRNLPIPIAPPKDMEMLSDCAKKQLELHAKLKDARLESDREAIQTAIDALDAKIDNVVYQIYGLTQDEIDKLK